MAEHGSSKSPQGVSANRNDPRRSSRDDNAITDIIPFNEFGDLLDLDDDLDFSNTSAFDRESRVIRAPELDDCHHTDDLIPLRLAVPSEFRSQPGDERRPPGGHLGPCGHGETRLLAAAIA